jgi:hypothetical protein
MYNYNQHKKYNYNQMYEHNQNEIHKRKLLFDYKYNISWLLIILINFISAKYFEYSFNKLDESNECAFDYDCNIILDLLIEKNNFLFVFMFVFSFVQIIIIYLSLLFDKIKIIKNILSNIFGIVYMTTSTWNNFILYLNYYDVDFFDSFRFYMRNNYLSDPIRLSIFYYLFGEIIGLIINFFLISLFLLGFTYLFLSLFYNLYFLLIKKIISNQSDKKYKLIE